MDTAPQNRIRSPWLIVPLLAVVIGLGMVELARLYLERSYKEALATEVQQRAFEVTAQTMKGNVMGSVANLGLVNLAMKQVVQGKLMLQDPMVMSTLQAIGELYDANGVYVVRGDGIIRSCYYTIGKTLTDVDVRFRPYFQLAMQGRQNIYAAIGTTTGKRSLYFAAPLYEKISASSPIIGAAVARLNLERVDSVLKAWHGHALLLSPQQITFASDRDDWVEQMTVTPSQDQLAEIRKLKQFGGTFENGTPKSLPFDIRNEIVVIEHQRFSVASAPVQWNDPQGEWMLVLLGNLDELMPISLRISIGTISGVLVLMLSMIVLLWRRRLQQAQEQRSRAEAELLVYTRKLESDSELKSYLAQLSNDLHQSTTLTDFARKLMHHVSQRIAADYGAFYVMDAQSGRLLPVGGHGVLADDLDAVEIGRGLVGQCAKNRAPIVIDDPTDTSIRIVWGGGQIEPRMIILLPVIQSEHLLGVIVLASLRKINAQKRDQLDAMLPMVAMNLEILNRNLGSQRLVWGSQYKIGVKVIDDQHQKLVGMFGTLSDAVKANQGNDVLEELLNELVDYTVYHFATEEGLMQTHAYPETAAHRKEHEDLKMTVAELQRKFKDGKATVTFQTVQLLNDWLSHHILKVDKDFAVFLNAKGVN